MRIANNQPDLCELIAQRIQGHPDRRITFAEYMDWLLYHPQHGYYSTHALNIGPKGDFVTAPHLAADFGELLAEQFVEMWCHLGQPNPFTLLEMGAGQGLLARDILRYLQQNHPQFWQSLDYQILEKSPAMIREQQLQLQGWPVTWVSWQVLTPGSILGCCFSNELVDAFPVHLVTVGNGQLQEVYVALAEGEMFEGEISEAAAYLSPFTEVLGDLSTPRLAEYFQLIEIDLGSGAYPEGYRTEVNLAALDWLTHVATCLQRGYVLTIDYGYPAHRYYQPRRDAGTLQCYYQHAHHNNPYLAIGQQDLTTHVNFTALEVWGEQQGLQCLGMTQQALFLMALGLGDRIAALSDNDQVLPAKQLPAFLQRRESLHHLIHPMKFGNFMVLVQTKGLSPTEYQLPLKGLTFPQCSPGS